MAESEKTVSVPEAQVSDTNNASRAKELKKELQRLAGEIIGDDQEDEFESGDLGVILGTMNKAIEALSALKELKKGKRSLDDLSVPDEFLCPISKEIMKDPVVLATGQTYDRPFIHKWLKDGNRTCPQTQQVLSHSVLTPNHLVRDLISQWAKDHGIQLPPPVKDVDEGSITAADKSRLSVLLEKLSSTLPEQKEAAKAIRSLTKKMPSFRTYFGESTDVIPQLLNPLSALEKIDDHPDLHEDLITVILNLSIHDNNKQLIAEHPLVMPLLVKSLKCGTIETKSNAAAALFTLSALDSNKQLIGESGALKPLIDLLKEAHHLAMKDVAAAIFNLCLLSENRVRAISDGAVEVILHKIMEGVFVDELLAILALLARSQAAIEELAELGAVSCLLGIIRESTCERRKENSVMILLSICLNNRAKLREVGQEEKANGTITKLAANGTARAKRKANSLLDRIHRGVYLTNTA